MVKTVNFFRLSSIALIFCADSLIAQEQLQPTGFLAEVVTEAGYDDNILRTAESFERSDSYFQVRPELSLTGIYGKHRFQTLYEGQYAFYKKYDEVNYNDHQLELNATFDHTYSLNSMITAGYQRQHEEPGDTDRIFNNFNEFNIFEKMFGDFRVIYGRDDSVGKLVFAYRRSDIDYKNNDQDFRDRTEDRFMGRFFYRMATNTRVLAEAIYMVSDHEEISGQFERDNDNIILRTGLTWDYSGLLTGELKVGYQKRDYDFEQAIDSNGLSYEAEIEWLPTNYSTWTLNARRLTIDSSIAEAGGFLRSLYSLEMNHKLSDSTKIYAVAQYTDDELLTRTGRQDNSYAARVTLTHKLNRLFEVGFGASHEKRNSNFEAATYESSSIKATVKLILD